MLYSACLLLDAETTVQRTTARARTTSFEDQFKNSVNFSNDSFYVASQVPSHECVAGFYVDPMRALLDFKTLSGGGLTGGEPVMFSILFTCLDFSSLSFLFPRRIHPKLYKNKRRQEVLGRSLDVDHTSVRGNTFCCGQLVLQRLKCVKIVALLMQVNNVYYDPDTNLYRVSTETDNHFKLFPILVLNDLDFSLQVTKTHTPKEGSHAINLKGSPISGFTPMTLTSCGSSRGCLRLLLRSMGRLCTSGTVSIMTSGGDPAYGFFVLRPQRATSKGS